MTDDANARVEATCRLYGRQRADDLSKRMIDENLSTEQVEAIIAKERAEIRAAIVRDNQQVGISETISEAAAQKAIAAFLERLEELDSRFPTVGRA